MDYMTMLPSTMLMLPPKKIDTTDTQPARDRHNSSRLLPGPELVQATYGIQRPKTSGVARPSHERPKRVENDLDDLLPVSVV